MKSILIISALLISSFCLGQGGEYDILPRPYSQESAPSWMLNKNIKKIRKFVLNAEKDSLPTGYYQLSKNGLLLKHSYNDEKNANEYIYNEKGHWITLAMQNGKIYNRIIEYNNEGDILKVTCVEDSAYSFVVEYDNQNRPVKKTKRNNTYYWTYYDNDSIKSFRKISTGNVWEPKSTNPKMLIKSYREYKYSDNRVIYIQTDSVNEEQINIDSIIVDFNENGQQINHTSHLGTKGHPYTSYVKTTYNKSGNIKKSETNNSKTIWFYDKYGLVEKIHFHLGSDEMAITYFYYEFY